MTAASPEPLVREPAQHELDIFASVVEAAFVFRFPADEREQFLAALDPGRCLVAEVEGSIVGTLASHRLELTVPGPRVVPVVAVTDLGALPTHRRRGVGSALVEHFLLEARRRGDALALLEARDGAFYRRFGFGTATWSAEYRLRGASALLQPGGGDDGELVMLSPMESSAALPGIFERHRQSAVGEITRPAEEWQRLLSEEKDAPSSPFVVAHLADGAFDGYLRYHSRVTEETLEVFLDELVANSGAAYRALYELMFTLGDDLSLRTGPRPTIEPARELLRDPRTFEMVRQRDRSWLRLIDIPRALELRRYRGAGELGLVIEDATCPWNSGELRLECDRAGVAAVRAADGIAELRVTPGALAAAYLGASSFESLVLAGEGAELVTGAARRADGLFFEAVPPFQGADL